MRHVSQFSPTVTRVYEARTVLAVQSGYRLAVRETSFDMGVGGGAEPVVDESQISEREVHYRDIVTIDYNPKRVRDEQTGHESYSVNDGTFVVSLLDGQRIEQMTLKEGVDSAVEYIRRLTRAAKIQGTHGV